MSDSRESRDRPSFDDPFAGEDVEQRIFGTLLGTREPTGASEIAERSDCDPKTARKYLNWFTELGVVTRHEGRPVTYERNDAYFEWRRVNDLASTHSVEELRSRIADLTERIESYRRTYDAEHPAEVDALDAGEDVDAVYADLNDWTTALQDRRLHERARQQLAGTDGRVSP
jgi:predicted transcriptional regulator